MPSLRKLTENASPLEVRTLLRAMVDQLNSIKSGTFTWDPPNVPANSTVATVLTSGTLPVLTGLKAGMGIKVTAPPTFPSGMVLDAFVATDNQLTVLLTNVTGSGIDIASLVWSFHGVTT